MNILVTGGAGYIGSHTCIELIEADHHIVVVDNLSNSSFESLARVESITNSNVDFYQEDVRDRAAMRKIFSEHDIDGVIHFAGLKAVFESVQNPIEYYDNNVIGTFALIEVMQEYGCKNFIFSSSATVYGDPVSLPIKENSPLAACNPYGRSKLIVEEFLQDLFFADNTWKIALLRYFNPVGAHKSGLIGEYPIGIPNNLMPYIAKVALGKLDILRIFGDDYDTHDGTGVRDYIHVMDLAKGHLKALTKILRKPQVLTVNLGTGVGYSVLDMVSAFEKTSGQSVPYKIVNRRTGDVPICYADPSYANESLNWYAKHNLEDMCKDTWRWLTQNPNGYND